MSLQKRNRVNSRWAPLLLPFVASLLGTVAAVSIAYFGYVQSRLDRVFERADSLQGYLSPLGSSDYRAQHEADAQSAKRPRVHRNR